MFIFEILIPVIIVVSIIGLVLRGIRVRNPLQDGEWYFKAALSREDLFSQIFWVLSILFLGVTLAVINRQFNSVFEIHQLIAIITVIGLLGTYYLKSVYLLFTSLIGLIIWWIMQTDVWSGYSMLNMVEVEEVIKLTAAPSGLFMLTIIWYLLAQLHDQKIKFKRFALVYLIFSLLFSVGIFSILSTEVGLTGFEFATKGASIINSWPTSVALLILFLLVIGLVWHNWQKRLIGIAELSCILLLTILFMLINFTPAQTLFSDLSNVDYYSYQLNEQGIIWAIIFNGLLFLELLAIIFLGYTKQLVWMINLGVFLLALTVILKYFDWFFTFLDKSLFFISAGILFFIVGWFMERGRRKLVAQIAK